MYRVICPDCAQPIALLADEDILPEHALCASPWNPFGLTVCAGTGTRGVGGPRRRRVRGAPGAGHRTAADAPSGTGLAHAALLARRRPGLAPDARAGDAPRRGLTPGPSHPPPGRLDSVGGRGRDQLRLFERQSVSTVPLVRRGTVDTGERPPQDEPHPAHVERWASAACRPLRGRTGSGSMRSRIASRGARTAGPWRPAEPGHPTEHPPNSRSTRAAGDLSRGTAVALA